MRKTNAMRGIPYFCDEPFLKLERSFIGMKKIYELPTAETTKLVKASFLEISGDVTANDNFNDDYGETFGEENA